MSLREEQERARNAAKKNHNNLLWGLILLVFLAANGHPQAGFICFLILCLI